MPSSSRCHTPLLAKRIAGTMRRCAALDDSVHNLARPDEVGIPYKRSATRGILCPYTVMQPHRSASYAGFFSASSPPDTVYLHRIGFPSPSSPCMVSCHRSLAVPAPPHTGLLPSRPVEPIAHAIHTPRGSTVWSASTSTTRSTGMCGEHCQRQPEGLHPGWVQ
jgi:hypothetical protein